MTKYQVQIGDTLAAIAQRFHTSIDEIVKMNKIFNPNLIYIGQTLFIPKPIHSANLRGKTPNTFYVSADGLLLALIIDKDIYHPADTITFTIIKLNIGNQFIIFDYPTTQRYDFFIFGSSSNQRVQWSYSHRFYEQKDRTTLSVGESIIYSEKIVLPLEIFPGKYSVIGWDTSQQFIHIPLKLSFLIK